MGAVLDHLGQHLAGLLDAKADGSAIGAAVDRQMRVIARTSLDGYSIGELQQSLSHDGADAKERPWAALN